MQEQRKFFLIGVGVGLAYEGLTAALALSTGYDAIWSWYQFVTPGIGVLAAFLGTMASRGGYPRLGAVAYGAAAAALLVLVIGAVPAFLAD
ncbi:MAG: hypothetical protein ACYTHK_17270 [Planctomycetota bacterium]|jgi:hypothetical protein